MKYNLSLSGKFINIFRLRFFWSRHPWLFYQAYSRVRYPKSSITKKTNILIEGFGRSGSSFTADSFKIANDNNIQLAWNQKSPSAIYEAIKWNIPTLVLIRDPKSVVISYKVMNPKLSIKLLLEEYIKYYSCIWRYRNHYLVCTNDYVWNDFNQLIKIMNNKFNINLNSISNSNELKKQVIKYQNSDYKKRFSAIWDESVQRTINYPTEFKKKLKVDALEDYESFKNKQLKNLALYWFEKFKRLTS
tara:strand:- start:25341 stop:26078 length:738 start_codon:yes stop_codon:yes gene_type:complete